MDHRKDFEFKDILPVLLKKWWLILLLTAVGFGAAFLASALFITPIYEAQTVLFIGNEDTALGEVDISLGSLSADSQLIVDYQQIAMTRLVIDPVIKNTNLNISYEDFIENVVIETIEDSRLFTVGFRNPDPTIAKLVSDELAKQLSLAALDVVGVENIRILDPAEIPVDPVSPILLVNALLGAFLFFLISSASIAVLYLMDDTVKNEADIESLLGVGVLGSIPEFENNG